MPHAHRVFPLYVVDRTLSPPNCFPISMSLDDLKDITAVGDLWRKYINIKTGEIHDCSVYWQKAQQWGEV